MNLRKRHLLIGLVAAATLGLPGTAAATPGNVLVSGAALGIQAGTNEVNTIRVSESPTWYVVEDATATLVAGGGCLPVTPHRVECLKTGVTVTRVSLKDLDDRFENGPH